MKLPAFSFIRKITVKKNGRRFRCCSEISSEDDVAEVGLHLDQSRGNIGREKLTSKQEQAPESALPSTVLPELSSSDDEHLDIVAVPQSQSRESLSTILNDDLDLSEVIGDYKNKNSFKFESSRSSLVPTRRMPRKKSMGGLSTSMASLSNGAENNSTGKCPFKHGTVYSGPYPGYVHGNPKRGICPNGCKAEMNSAITEGESTAETMMREAMEYLELYYHERSEDMSGTEGFLPKKERMIQVKRAINETGTYVHTFDELGKIPFFFV